MPYKDINMNTVSLNHPVPDCKLPTPSHPAQTLHGLHGKTLVLYFYPKDNTPGCTQEGKDFSLLHDEFVKANAVVLGISRDSQPSHEKFKTKYCFPFELVSDPDSHVCKLFDVLQPKNVLGKIANMIQRSTFVIDAKGVLRQEWRGVKVTDHAKLVLEVVQKLK